MSKTKVSLDSLLAHRRTQPYELQYQYIRRLEEAGEIEPVKASGSNGRKPALFRTYWKIVKDKDYSALLQEIQFRLSPFIHNDYYLRHPAVYEKERQSVLLLDQALASCSGTFPCALTVNERSYDIWHKEKFLSSGGGKTLLSHCGLSLEDLDVIRTAEPFASFCASRQVPQNVLILENKDPFYSMRRFLLGGNKRTFTGNRNIQEECDTIFGIPIGTLIYGAGERVVSTFKDFSLSAEPYLTDPANTFLYFGDLDYVGIGIYENLASRMKEQKEQLLIRPMVPAYKAMLSRAESDGFETLPETREGQNEIDGAFFFSFFEDADKMKMRQILERRRYIPQEILNITDYG